MHTSPDALPPPEEYARLGFEARGAIIAGLSCEAVRAYARQYAAYLTELGGYPVTEADVIPGMFVCAVGWRGRYAKENAS